MNRAARSAWSTLRFMGARQLAALLSIMVTTGSCERRSTHQLPLRTYTLAGLALQLELPDDATVQESAGSVVIIVHPGRRTPLRIDLKRAAAAGAFDNTAAKRQALTANLQLVYRESVQPGGSGGEDAILDGELALFGERYRVTCQQQSESSPSAQACLPILATLRTSAK